MYYSTCSSGTEVSGTNSKYFAKGIVHGTSLLNLVL